jgi:hypothetical protein
VWDAAWDAWAENDCSAAAAIIKADRAAVEAATIAKVVAWLREQDGHGYDDVRANCIEAGEWKQ